MRVLVVDDEPAATQFVRKGLRGIGHAVDVAETAEEALYKVSVNDYDILLLDVVLGGRSGLYVCREVRAHNSHISILMLTARDGVDERVRGLDAGADDYLVKPYQFAELVARIRALARRGPMRHLDQLNVADLQLDLRRRAVTRAGKPIDLTGKEYALLEYLARHQGEVMSRTDISEHVWDERYDPFSNVIEVYVQRLRKKIDDAGPVRLLHTRRGQGYVLEPRATEAAEALDATLHGA